MQLEDQVWRDQGEEAMGRAKKMKKKKRWMLNQIAI